MNKFIIYQSNVPLAPPAGNRELMHNMTISFRSRFVLDEKRKEWSYK